MPKSVTIDKEILKELFQKVKDGELTIDQYQNILLNNVQKVQKEKIVVKEEKRDITKINEDAHLRKKQIKKWKKENPGKTELQRINEDSKIVLEKINELIKKGAKEIIKPTYDDIENIKDELGNRLFILYILKDGQYRSGGFLTANSDYYFVLLDGQVGNKISFSVQFNNVASIYVRQVNKKNNTKPIKPVPTPHFATKYPVKIENIVVYYAKDNFDKRRFMNTQKYANMLKYKN